MAKGDIVLVTFPFTDLSGSKLRPAVVLAETNTDITVSLLQHRLAGRSQQTYCLAQVQ